MNSKFLNAIVLLGLCLSISCTQETINALEQIKANQFANDFVGQQIVDTVLLQQKSGGAADVVVRLLNGLVQDLAKQQQVHTAQFQKNNAQWKAQLKSYRATVASLTKQIATLALSILRTRRAIKSTRYNIRYKVSQISLVSGKLQDLNAARNVDRQAYLKRSTRQTEMQKAVSYIIGQLQLALKAGAFVQLNDIKEQLAKLSKENPLQALVELTMTFNPASVNFAITKLNEVQTSLFASLKDEVVQEAQAQRQYLQLKRQLSAFLAVAGKQLAKLRSLLVRQLATLRSLRKQRAEALALRVVYVKLISQTVAARKAYNAQYRAFSAKRASETSVINQVVTIIQINAPSVNRSSSLSFSK